VVIYDDYTRRLREREVSGERRPMRANTVNDPLMPTKDGTRSLPDFASSLHLHGYNILAWARSEPAAGRAQDAYRKLTAVRGIGEKIAPFAFRDVVSAYGIGERTIGNAASYLQPIDAWTTRGTRALARGFNRMEPNSVRECAEVLVQLAAEAGVSGCDLNAGLWVLGAELVRDQEIFWRLLTRPTDLDHYLARQSRVHAELAEMLARIASSDAPNMASIGSARG
jgi:hypothetical protein